MTQVDFEKAFVQDPLKRPMYMNLTPGLNDAPHLKGIFFAYSGHCMVTDMPQSFSTNY